MQLQRAMGQWWEVEVGGGVKTGAAASETAIGSTAAAELPLHRRHSLTRSAFLVAPIALFLLSLADFF